MTTADASAEGFGDRLAGRVMRRESQLVLGLDPDPALLWSSALELVGGVDASSAPPAVRAARAVAAHCALVIDAVGEHCVAVKPQVACFERLGAPGWEALTQVVAKAREADLMVIADAKRGDIDVTARAYAQAFLGATPSPFGPIPGLGADAMTVSPWLGSDSLEPFTTIAREVGAGLFVLVRNSNRGAVDLQDRELADGSLSDLVARMVDALAAEGVGGSGLSDVGAVVGATAPNHLGRLRGLMPGAVFLLPGVGAQGGRVDDLRPVFTRGPASGLIAVSRGIVQAHRMTGGDPAAAARREAARLREQAWALVA
ncbi:MAG TPA: orotidine-5'-phosphate decarboxylase [Solirubrobacteraceae bacterium]|nr:orotidine-5'-phosphate decarboxylase [Solirubrobacteraceae bacterium]